MRPAGCRRALAALLLAGTLAGCATLPFEDDARWPPADALLLGEQHDAAAHQQISARVVNRLAARGRLSAVVLEMAERGHSTAALSRDASEAAVRAALAWDERGWPWRRYGAIVMHAVRAGVPVVGGNLPRAALREAMQDTRLDGTVDAALRERLQDDVREGHCKLLPAAQLPAMTRVQIARDRALADTLREQWQPGRLVVLVAGSNHVDATRGVPQQLRGIAATMRPYTVRLAAGAAAGEVTPGFDETWPTPAVTRHDPCEGLAERLQTKPPR